MQDVLASVRQVSDVIGTIATSMREQSAGIAQVNKTISDLDQVTQQNASLVEQSTAASESLKQQAGALAESVAVFRLASEFASDGAGRNVTAPGSPRIASKVHPSPLPKKSLPPISRKPDEDWKEF